MPLQRYWFTIVCRYTCYANILFCGGLRRRRHSATSMKLTGNKRGDAKVKDIAHCCSRWWRAAGVRTRRRGPRHLRVPRDYTHYYVLDASDCLETDNSQGNQTCSTCSQIHERTRASTSRVKPPPAATADLACPVQLYHTREYHALIIIATSALSNPIMK